MKKLSRAPENSYGMLQQTVAASALDQVVESVRSIGYGILDSGYGADQLKRLSVEFDRVHRKYLDSYGEARLKGLEEHNTIRAPLAQGSDEFLALAFNGNLLQALKKLIMGKFILNQQNGIINPPQQTYNQGVWHRDLPYQHFVSSTPLAINALFCLDDFTFENGATFVLPASHKLEAFPSSPYVQKNALQIEAKAGSFIVLDCMLFHAGGFNATQTRRRAVNHIYNIPYFKQQINLPANMRDARLSTEQSEILGFRYVEPVSVAAYLSGRGPQKDN
nr:putative phytanoyl-CoA dioxygenase family protein [uncultured bacterium]